MAGDVENVGGIGISLEIDDKTENQLSAIENRLLELVQPRKVLVELGYAPPKGGTNPAGHNEAEDKLVRSLTQGLNKFTEALAKVEIKIDPDSISSLARAIREAIQEPSTGPSAYAAPRTNAFTLAAARTTGPTSAQARIDETARGVARGEIIYDRTYASQRRASGGSPPPRRGRVDPIRETPSTPPPHRKNAFEEAAERARAIAEEPVRPEPLYAKQRQKVSAARPVMSAITGRPRQVGAAPKAELYRDVEVVQASEIWGGSKENPRQVAAKYNPRRKKIVVDEKMLRGQFEARGWRDMATLSDESQATPLPDEMFPTYEDYRKFVLEHEYQHSVTRRDPGEKLGEYEDRINAQARAAGPRESSFIAARVPATGRRGRVLRPHPEHIAGYGTAIPGEETRPSRDIPLGDPYSSKDSVLDNIEKRLATARSHGTRKTVAQLEQERRARMQVLERGEPTGARYAADADILKQIFDEITHPGAALVGLTPEEPTYSTTGGSRLGGYDVSRGMFGMGLGGDITARQRMQSRMRTQFAAEQRGAVYSTTRDELARVAPGAGGYRAPREGTVVGRGGESISAGRVIPRAVVGKKSQEMPQLPFGFESEPTGAAIARVVERARSAISGGATEGPDAALLGYYRLVSPERVDLSKLPEETGKTDKERRRSLEKLRFPAYGPLMESTTERLGVRGASEFRLPEDFEIPALAGQKVSRVPRDVAFLEEVARELGLDSIDQLFYRQSGKALREAKVRKAQEHLASLPTPGHAVSPESGGRLLGQGPPTVEPGDLPQMYATGRVEPKPTEEIARRAMFGISTGRPLETGPRGLRSLEAVHRARRVINKRMQRHGPRLDQPRPGYLSPATETKPAQWVDPAAQEYIKNFALSQIEGEDIPWEDPEFTTLGNMLFLRSLGNRDQRSGQYRDTDKYPITSPDDIRRYMRMRPATSGFIHPRWKTIRGKPGSGHWVPGRGEEYSPGLTSRWTQRYGKVPRAAQMLLNSVYGQLREEHGGFQRGLGIEPGYSYGGTSELYERGARRNAADERELMRAPAPIAMVGRPAIGGLRYSAEADLLRKLQEREARLRWEAEVSEYEQRKARVGEEFVEHAPTPFPMVAEPAARGARGRDVPISLASPGAGAPTGPTTWRALTGKEGTDESLGTNLQEVRANRRAALQRLVEEPTTEAFKSRTFPEQRAIRYESTVAETILAREEAEELRQLVLERKAGRKEKKRYRALLPREFGGRGQIEDLEADAAREREKLAAPRAETVADRVAAGDTEGAAKILRQERDRVIERERRRFLADQSTGTKKLTSMKQLTPSQSAQWSGKLALINKRFGDQIDALGSGGTPARTERITGDVPIPTISSVEERAEAAGGIPPTPPTAPPPPEVTAAGGGAGGGGTFTGEVTLGGQPIHVIVDEVTKASAIESAIGKIKATIARPEKKAATTKPVEDEAEKGPKWKVPEGATAYGPSGGARPTRAFGPTLTGWGAGGPEAAYETDVARMKAETNIEARQAAQQMKAEEQARAQAKKLPTREKMIHGRMEEIYAAAEAVSPIDRMDPLASGMVRSAAEAGIEPKYQDLITRAKEIYEGTAAAGVPASQDYSSRWDETLRELKRQQGEGIIPPNLFAGEEDISVFRGDVRKALGFRDVRATTRGAPRPPRIAREQTVQQRFEAAIREMGISPAAAPEMTGAQQPPGLLGKTEEGENIDVYDTLIANQAAAAAQGRELGLRALSTMGIQYVGAKLGPYERINERQRQLAKLTTTARKETRTAGEMLGSFRETAMPKYFEAKAKAEAPGASPADIAAFGRVRTEYLELAKATRQQRLAAIDAVKAQEEASIGITTAGDAAQHFAASFAGGVVGGVIGSFAGMIAQPIFQAVASVITEVGSTVMDQMTGWSTTRTRTLEGMQQATTAQGGLARQAFAGQYATIAPEIAGPYAPMVIEQGRVQSANEQLTKLRDLVRASNSLSQLGTGNAAPGLTKNISGFAGTWAFGNAQSTSEILTSLMKEPGGVDTINQLFEGRYGKGQYRLREITEQDRATNQSALNMQMGVKEKLGFSAPGYALTDDSGQIVQGKDALDAFIAALNDATQAVDRTNATQLLNQMQPQMRAQTQQMEWQKNFSLETLIPQQRGMQWLANPMMPYGSTWMPGQQANLAGQYSPEFSPYVADAQAQLGAAPAGLGPMGINAKGQTSAAKYSIPGAATQSFNQYKAIGVDAFQQVQRAAEAGIRALQNAGVPAATIESLRQYGAQAVAIQAQMAAIQSGRSETKYQRSLYMANRALTDARQLAGQIGRTANSNVGYYERQLMLINRQNQALSLQLQKRQILTQLALARFQVPGETGEERYARRREAEIAASIQQKQLGLATSAFQTEIKLVDEQNLRAVQDAAYAVQEIKLDYKAQKAMEALQDALTKVQAASQSLLPEAQVFVEFKNNYEQFMAGIAADIAAKTGENMTKVLTTVREYITNDPVMSQVLNLAQRGGSDRSGANDSNRGRSSGSNYGSAGGVAPSVTKTITSVDIKNGFVINFTGDMKMGQDQINEMVADLQTQVVQSFNRIAQLIGLRPVAR